MNLTDMSVVREIAEKHDFHFSKGLGQNFLINPSVCPKIAELGKVDGIGVIEIGTGFGVLTKELAKRAKKVCAVEIDDRLFPILEDTLKEFSNIEIIHQDFTKLDLNSFIAEKFGDMPVVVCANLPYYLTSPILMQILESRSPVQAVTVMVQKEAADRLCAEVGSRECGAVTVATNFYGKAEKLFSVSRGSFYPAPKVDSAVIQIVTYGENSPWNVDAPFFFSIVKAGFSQRRKTMMNALSNLLSLPKNAISEALTEIGKPVSARIEQLTMEDLCAFSNILQKKIGL